MDRDSFVRLMARFALYPHIAIDEPVRPETYFAKGGKNLHILAADLKDHRTICGLPATLDQQANRFGRRLRYSNPVNLCQICESKAKRAKKQFKRRKRASVSDTFALEGGFFDWMETEQADLYRPQRLLLRAAGGGDLPAHRLCGRDERRHTRRHGLNAGRSLSRDAARAPTRTAVGVAPGIALYAGPAEPQFATRETLR